MAILNESMGFDDLTPEQQRAIAYEVQRQRFSTERTEDRQRGSEQQKTHNQRDQS